MTKEFQKELLEKVKPGVKASDLRKLKKSKSTGDLPNTPKSQPLQHSKSQQEIPTAQQPSLAEQIKQLKDQVKFHAETAANYLQSLQTSQAKVSELETDLSVVKAFNKDLQEKLKEKTTELDNSLLARYEAVKQFGKIYDKLQGIRKELDENVDQASDEIISADDKVSSLRTKLFTARQQINSLQRDLNLAQKLAEMRKYPLPNKESNWDYLKYPLYSLVIVLFTFWLTNHLRKNNQQ